MNTAMSQTTEKLMRTLRSQLKAAPKQAMVLGGLIAVFLVVLIRMIFVLGPDSAQAVSLPPSTTISTSTLASLPASMSTQSSTVALAARRPLPELREQVVRDIFSTNWLAEAWQPRLGSVVAGHSDPLAADQPVPEFTLELTITGAVDSAQHCAVINGKRLRVGEIVSGYVVETISPGLVVLLGSWRNRVVIRMN